MHRPWRHSNLILNYFHDGRITNESLRRRLQEKMAAAYDLEQIALRRGIPIEEPFQGSTIGLFHVLSPDRDWYVHDLIAEFEKSPERRADAAAYFARDSARTLAGIFGAVTETAKKAITWATERWDIELLRENVETSAENESSAILYAYMAEHQHGVLLTGDAGVKALARANAYLRRNNIDPTRIIKFYQIPHHGGRHNVSTSVLDQLVGSRLKGIPASFDKVAFVSASEEAEYPRNMVANAFIRRGAKVIATKGASIRHSRGMPDRGWSSATSIEFSSLVEAWD
jgi:hypothetical protein